MKTKGKIITLTMLATATTGAIYIINKFRNLADTVEDIFSHIDGEYYNWRFGKIFYTKQGSGKPILLIHDLNATSSHCEWNQIIEELSKTNTVYALDLLGCGKSDKPNLTYTNFLYVQLINDFIKHIIEEKTDIMATSEASAIAIMACSNNAELVNRIILVNPISPISLAKIPTKKSTIIRDLINLPIIGTLLYNILIRRTTITNDFRTKFFHNPGNVTDKIISTYLESSHIGDAHSKYLYASIVSRYTNANIMQALNHINNSIYIIVGTGNPENILAADQYQNELPAIEIANIENAKLLPQLEVPKEFMEQLSVFLETV
ncbi:MAG: alpha/beta fold hydrolase [Hespellia sp.]|nr:alpha/beta fold hydrolase [Hespellia sp.]